MDLRDRTSNLEKFGDCPISHDIVGPPLTDGIRQAAMLGSAASGSHLSLPTSLRPERNDELSCTFKPVTWNSGTVRIMDGQNSGFCSTSSGASSAPMTAPHSQPMTA